MHVHLEPLGHVCSSYFFERSAVKNQDKIRQGCIGADNCCQDNTCEWRGQALAVVYLSFTKSSPTATPCKTLAQVEHVIKAVVFVGDDIDDHMTVLLKSIDVVVHDHRASEVLSLHHFAGLSVYQAECPSRCSPQCAGSDFIVSPFGLPGPRHPVSH
ncbi:hypothetical protein EYF80_005079 [Liparis tanakae]|uniref:Uncharacterized protein n=1 Tax=Liparis tanakae TaxID=230148 RepID=A0A4Z2J448_9TELE|nr:hypothetical protein EYF80_005079 [Liparis tanakae]